MSRLIESGDGAAAEVASTEPVEVVELGEHYVDLRTALADGRKPPAGRLLGLPELPDGDVWVDMAGAAAVAGAQPRTITGWLSRQGPKCCPFPAPHRILYRLYWPLSTIGAWRGRHDHGT